jgi:hypothetical protein
VNFICTGAWHDVSLNWVGIHELVLGNETFLCSIAPLSQRCIFQFVKYLHPLQPLFHLVGLSHFCALNLLALPFCPILLFLQLEAAENPSLILRPKSGLNGLCPSSHLVLHLSALCRCLLLQARQICISLIR